MEKDLETYYSTQGVGEIEDFLHTSLIHGLQGTKVGALQEKHGKNKLEPEEKDHIAWRFIEQFKDPLILMLLASAMLSLLIGQIHDSLSILGAVIIVGSVAFYQEYQSEQTLESLTDLVPPTCSAIRDDIAQTLLAEELVPGDLLKLSAGDRIPADCRIVDCTQFTVDESPLTGESEPLTKTCGDRLHVPPEGAQVNEKSNLVFMGTLVTTGHAKALVYATGAKTEFGKNFEEMKGIESSRTPLQEKMDELGKQLSIFSFAVISVIAVLGVFQGKTLLSMFNIGVSLAVAAIPEGLPICVTVTLALGVMRMAKKQAIVKKLPAVEALGCANYICCDKTGTLTQNKMTVMSVYTPALDELVRVVEGPLEGTSASLSRESKAFASEDEKRPLLGEDSTPAHEFSSRSRVVLVTERNKQIEAARSPSLQDLFDSMCLCNNAQIAVNGTSTSTIGQPTECAMLVAAAKVGVKDRRCTMKKISEVPFSSETKRMECCYRENEASQAHVRVCKGALESVLARSSHYRTSGNEVQILTKEMQKRLHDVQEDMASSGLRVLAVAKENGQEGSEYTFCGLVGLMDPLRTGVSDAVTTMKQSGASVIMITGDSMTTAVSISTLAGICEPSQNVVHTLPSGQQFSNAISGQDIEELAKFGDDVLASVLEKVQVCYRTTPRHKLSIVRSLQSRGHVVCMTGDGVNDAPALKKADIGVAVGSGTDVAKEAAHMVIVDDDFSTIVKAIEEGKCIFFNIKNFLTFQLSTSVAALSLVALNNLLGRPNPLNPMQILWINIIMDGPLAQSLGVEPIDPTVMAKPPRKRDENILSRPLLVRVITSSILILLGTLYMFLTELDSNGETTSRGLTMTFTTFVMFDMFNAFTCRNNNKPFYLLSFAGNGAFLAAMLFSLFGQFLVIFFAPLQDIFRTESLSFTDLLRIVGMTSTILILDTVRKLLLPNIFTEVPAGGYEQSFPRSVDGQQGQAQPVRVFQTYQYGLQDRIQSLLGGWSPLGLAGGQSKKQDTAEESKV